ncbi:transcriptional regulator, LysR family [Roseovarius tolerans]|uniref:Transcriptional regulator, LysR family n=1 Tax=Roseovarius tolerans TaxID=74031 RepID=A0A1H8F811_9RHOB|nr:LysR family transcriptional regulator [Roseovarius tolerans]SEN27188.1 transcriptional regulator, LysR family [Roseovarius tolerans]
MALTLKAMEYFTTALRHGNIAKAAGELNIAASAISSAIDQVEAEFDLTLVTRHRARGIQANASGRAVARKCERLLEEYRSVLTEGAELKHALSGTLRIGYYAPIAPAFLPQILDTFLTASTTVALEMTECDNDQAQDGLLDGTFDVALFVAQGVRPSVDFDTLIAAPPYCLLPATHPLTQQISVSMEEIAKEPLVVLNRPVAASYYEGLFQPGARQAPVVAYANSTEMVRSLVASGRGCAILNMRPLTSESYTGAKVVARPISDDLPPLTLAIGYEKSRPRRSVQEFVEACQTYFAKAGSSQCIVEC